MPRGLPHFVCIVFACVILASGCASRFGLSSSSRVVLPSSSFDKIVVRTRIIIECDENMKSPAKDFDDIMRDIKFAESIFGDLNLRIDIVEITRTSDKRTWEECFDLDAHKYDNYMSIYYIKDKIVLDQETFIGIANFPWNPSRKGIVVCGAAGRATLAHEIGHYFGLRHTFDGAEDITDTLSPEQYSRVYPGLSYRFYSNLMNYRYSDNGVEVTPKQIDKMKRFAMESRADIIDWRKSLQK